MKAAAVPNGWKRVARLADLDGEGPHAVAAGDIDLVVVHRGNQLKVFEGRCPHQGALLGEGELDGNLLVCRNHRWKFDTATGQRKNGPQCLKACPSEIRDDALWVDTTPLDAPTTTGKAGRRIADLPGPRGLPFFGSLFDFDIERLHGVFEDWARTYGAVYQLKAAGQTMVVLSDPALINDALRARPETFRRDERVEPVFAELGVAGVFSAEGAAWRPQRRLAMEALAQKNLRGFYPTLAAVAARLQRRWERSAGTEVDLVDDLMRFTVDVTTTLVFGRDLFTLDGGKDVIQRDLALVFPAFARRLNSLIPYWRLLRLPQDRRVDRAIASLRVWLAALIADTRQKLAADPHQPPTNFLESMLASRDDDGKPFSDEVIFGNCMTMLLAGEDTTANSVAWAVHLLLDHPAEVAALRQELDATLRDAPLPRDLEEANRLERATAVANESMRLLPVAPINFLHALHDTTLGDLAIPKGTAIVLLTRIAATDEKYFAEPARFLPERWMIKDGRTHDPSAHQPFGSGPRICPGRSLALIEMRVMLATLYRNFDVTRVGSASDVKEHYSFTMMPTNLRVRITPRKPAQNE